MRDAYNASPTKTVKLYNGVNVSLKDVMDKKIIKKYITIITTIICGIFLSSCSVIRIESKYDKKVITFEDENEIGVHEEVVALDDGVLKKKNDRDCVILDMVLKGDEKYYDMSVINDGHAYLYVASDSDIKKNFTVTINAGHGVKHGSSYKTYSHPDKSPKLSGGTNAEGEVMSIAISEGMVFDDGSLESEVNLKVAEYLRDTLLDFGYNVLMIREDENSRLDNIARTILANNHSDVHISIHFDSTNSDKGMFVILPIEDETYLSMEPVKSNYEKTNELGLTLIEAFRENNEKMWNDGRMLMDLTQISYSTIPSVDLELGDKATDTSEQKLKTFVPCIVYGIEKYYHSNR